jgi:hypothetical protein
VLDARSDIPPHASALGLLKEITELHIEVRLRPWAVDASISIHPSRTEWPAQHSTCFTHESVI